MGQPSVMQQVVVVLVVCFCLLHHVHFHFVVYIVTIVNLARDIRYFYLAIMPVTRINI